ncbi:MAG: sulfatase-like hydrolase/transferase, partial [Planctomycetota bacterium]
MAARAVKETLSSKTKGMTRRDFLKSTAVVGAGGFMLSNRAVEVRVTNKKYNVLFIAIDDLNDWIGCLGGHPDAKTPNLDRLANMGVLFTNAHCSAPVCNPSRASLMTGILPSTSGVYANGNNWRQFLPDAVTLPQHFMANGYKAIGRGKIYHGQWPDTNPGAWDEYISKGSDPPPLKTDPRYMNPTGNIEWGPVDGVEEEMDDYKVAMWGAEQLGKEHDKPFFLACGFFKPHLKWCAPAEYFDMFPADKVTLPNIDENDLDDVPPVVAGYLACGAFVDRQVGRLLDALETSPHRDNTIVVLWSDHGWHLGEKLHWKKFALWEEATRNVFITVVPGLTRAGSKCSRPVTMLDIYPTLIEVCRLSGNSALEGVSLKPLLKNPNAPWSRPALTT